MDTYEVDVVRRNVPKKENEAEILDEDQQQEVIDDLKQEYEKILKSQNISFIVLTVIVSFVCLFASFKMEFNKILFSSTFSYLSLLVCERIGQYWCWISSASLEILSIILTYNYSKTLPTYVLIIIHAGYIFLALFLADSKNALSKIPNEIENLQQYKYGSKLA